MKIFDAIVIGSGMGGLTCAGILAAGGMKVLVIEKHSSAGGYVSSFRRKGFLFDSAVDCISGAGSGGLIHRVLEALGVAGDLKFLRVDPIRVSRFPDFDIAVDADIGIYKERLVRLFPSESISIANFFTRISRAYSQMDSALRAIMTGSYRFDMISGEVLRLMDRSYGDLLDEHFRDHRLKAVLSDRCPFIGLPPGGVSASAMINLMMSYFDLGAFRPEGGFQHLADLIVEAIRRKGGEVVFGNGADRILLNPDNRCTGVRCESGEEYNARHIVSNADFTHTFGKLIGGKYAELAADMREWHGISTSFFILYAGVRGKLDAHSSLGYYPSYDMSRYFEPDMEFQADSTIGVTIASREDRHRAPHGCETVVFHEMTGSHDILDKGKCTGRILDKAELIFPGIRERMELIEAATPSTLRRYTGNCEGAAFGWRQIPGFKGPKRHRINNLYVAGHWGDFGGGVLAAAYSGAKAACEIMTKEGIAHVI